jgi:hypothetical protein
MGKEVQRSELTRRSAGVLGLLYSRILLARLEWRNCEDPLRHAPCPVDVQYSYR